MEMSEGIVDFLVPSFPEWNIIEPSALSFVCFRRPIRLLFSAHVFFQATTQLIFAHGIC